MGSAKGTEKRGNRIREVREVLFSLISQFAKLRDWDKGVEEPSSTKVSLLVDTLKVMTWESGFDSLKVHY